MKKVILSLFVWLALLGCARAETKLYDFYADWCAPCNDMIHVVQSLTDDGYNVVRVNVDKEPQAASLYNVTRIPAFVVVRDGKEVGREIGTVPRERLERLLKKPGVRVEAPGVRVEVGRQAPPSVVRIYCMDTARTRSIGSGVLVRWGSRIVVLTARHVVEDAVKAAGKIVIRLAGGVSHWGVVVKMDKAWDCAVLTVTGDQSDLTPAELAFGDEATFKDGDSLSTCGFGPNDTFKVNTGRFLGYRRSQQAGDGRDDWMAVSGPARSGDSGGPVFNARGKVVGVLWGTNGQETICVQAGKIHAVLSEAFPPAMPSNVRSFRLKSDPTIAQMPQGSLFDEKDVGQKSVSNEALPPGFKQTGRSVPVDPPVVQIFRITENKVIKLGQGVLVSWYPRTVVVTATAINVSGEGHLSVETRSGVRTKAAILPRAEDCDCSALIVQGELPSAVKLALSRHSKDPPGNLTGGEKVQMFGFRHDDTFASATGRFVEMTRNEENVGPGYGDWMVVRPPEDCGNTFGWGIFTGDEKLIGIAYGPNKAGTKDIVCIGAEQIYRMLTLISLRSIRDRASLFEQKAEWCEGPRRLVPVVFPEETAVFGRPRNPTPPLPADPGAGCGPGGCGPGGCPPNGQILPGPGVSVDIAAPGKPPMLPWRGDAESRDRSLDARIGALERERQQQPAPPVIAQPPPPPPPPPTPEPENNLSPILAGLVVLGAVVAGLVIANRS